MALPNVNTPTRTTRLKPVPRIQPGNVREIRARYFAGVNNQRELGVMFHTSQENISAIVRFKTHRYV